MTLQNQEFIAGLKAKFAEHRIVFWHDPDKRFLEELDNLELENVTLLDMTDQSQLAVKKRIEIDEPEQQFLLWFPHDAPQKSSTGYWIFVFIVRSSTPISPPLR
ncbi:hypothetical protein RB531_640 [Salmonella enterica subsp. enterica serovar Typhimurium]